MQFVSNGPDVPSKLLELHEENKVVFFCGAGISYDAGLPTFSGLTDKLYEELGEPKSDVESQLIDEHKYDLAINLLEGRTIGGRYSVRKKLAKILTPNPQVYSDVDAMTVHNALLSLSQDREGQCKLVTTNFDRIFEKLIEINHLDIPTEVAPYLPLPKKGRWNSLVYLHGRLPEKLDEFQLNRLVISSGDFGLAYLIERWASRFVTELFRNYSVCFVGYSLNDPVMRYMMDALAADRLLGGLSPDMFIFVSCENEGDRAVLTKSWEAKGVVPILYEAENGSHHLLKDTLSAWSKVYRDGILGKEQLIVKNATGKPSKSTIEDDFVTKVIWALSDTSGLPAKRFAEMEPSPSLDWLEPITQHILKDEDRNNISLVSHREDFIFPLDNPKKYIIKWLLSHIDNPKLIVWIAEYGGRLHPAFVRDIENLLEKKELRKELLALWRIVLTERAVAGRVSFDLYRWSDLLKINGFTPSLRMHLREILKPLVKINKSLDIYGEIYSDDNIKKYLDWEIVLFAGHAKSSIDLLKKKPEWNNAQPLLLSDFTALLQDTLEIMVELGEAKEQYDTTSWHMPSVETHPQNHGFRDWTLLIELVRDAWLEAAKSNVKLAKTEVLKWQNIRYPVFRRLTFFAGAKTDLFSNSELIAWLLEDDYFWLWSNDTKREMMRLLVSLAERITPSECERIEDAILLGAPRNMYRNDVSPEDFKGIQDRGIWLRLAKLYQAGAPLSKKVKEKLDVLSKKYPKWRLAEDERDEFITWMSSGFEGEEFSPVPRDCNALKKWLKQEKKDSAFERDDWEDFSGRYYLYSSQALREVSRENKWNIRRWNTAFYSWSRTFEKKKSIYQYWSKTGEALLGAPDEVLLELSHSVTYWLQGVAKYSIDDEEELFFKLVNKILDLYQEDEISDDDGDQVSKAINHPIGKVIEAVLTWWKRNELKDDMGIIDTIKSVLSDVCSCTNTLFIYGQLIIATDTITLYRVDKKWTETYLLPLFNWAEKPENASAVWKGLLWSPRAYEPLLRVIKSEFLETANHCLEMGEFGKQYASLLTFVAIESKNIFTKEELIIATRTLPKKCLVHAANTFVDLFGSSQEKQEYWENRLYPYLHNIWPKDRDFITDAVVNKFAMLCTNSDEMFPQVFDYIQTWLRPLDEDPHYILHKMKEKEFCKRFPEDALNFLNKIIDHNIQWSQSDLKFCLEGISDNDKTLLDSDIYKKLVQSTIS